MVINIFVMGNLAVLLKNVRKKMVRIRVVEMAQWADACCI